MDYRKVVMHAGKLNYGIVRYGLLFYWNLVLACTATRKIVKLAYLVDPFVGSGTPISARTPHVVLLSILRQWVAVANLCI